ncbi:hypothetical protein BX600DRAFT_475813 [Xylariales sp. PMI_506]|nr:hypothetical protein BX600DRAFT_475813 [Xylariales sp. PMI_506]
MALHGDAGQAAARLLADLPAPKVSRSRNKGPSRGCNQCRLRKVKCDEVRPSCAKCLTRDTVCVYRDAFERVLRDRTQWAAAAAQKNWRIRAKNSKEPPLLQDKREQGPENSMDREEPSKALATPVEDLVKHRFMFDFFVEREDPNGPRGQICNDTWFKFVPGMYKHAEAGIGVQHRPLSAALSAVSAINFAKRCQSTEAYLKSIESYGKAIQELKTSLQAPNAAPKTTFDHFTSIFLLSLYELMAPLNEGFDKRIASWKAHSDGATTLLQGIAKQAHRSEELDWIIISILGQMQLASMSRSTRPKISLQLCHQLVPRNHEAMARLVVQYRVTDYVIDWREADKGYTHNGEDGFLPDHITEYFIARGLQLDREVSAWMNKTLRRDKIQTLLNHPINVPMWLREVYSSIGAPTMLYRYENFHVAHQWELFGASRLAILSTVIYAVQVRLRQVPSSLLFRGDMEDGDDSGAEYASSQDAHYSAVKKMVELRMLVVIDEMCKGTFSVLTVPIQGKPQPQGLADVIGIRGYQLLWPLGKAVLCFRCFRLSQYAVNGRLKWLRMVRSWIKSELGLGIYDVVASNPSRGPVPISQ